MRTRIDRLAQTYSLRNRRQRRPVYSACLLGLAAVFAAQNACWSQSLEEGLLPGLIAEYAASDHSTVQDVVEGPGLDLRSGPPVAGLKGEMVEVTYRGLWLPDGAGAYRWWLSGEGDFRVQVNQQLVGSGQCQSDSVLETEPFTVTAQWQTIEITARFSSLAGRLRVSTSSPSFLPEPLSPLRLAHEETHAEADSFVAGRRLVQALQCRACHSTSDSVAAPRAPALFTGRPLASESWLRTWLRDHAVANESDAPEADDEQLFQLHDQMPQFDMPTSDIESLLAYLGNQAERQSEPGAVGHAEEIEAGRAIFYQTGCVACHALEPTETVGLNAGPRLVNIGAKRSHAELLQWLQDPRQVDPRARMAKVPLSEEEQRFLVSFLSSLRLPEASSEDRASESAGAEIERGRKLFQAFRCGACHQQSPEDPSPPGSAFTGEFEIAGSCIDATPSEKNQPRFLLSPAQRTTIKQYLNHSAESQGTDVAGSTVRARLHELGCFNCHTRNFSPGLNPLLDDHATAIENLKLDPVLLRPPALNGVGDKLTEAAWNQILDTGLRRREWLTVRMPEYRLTAQERDQIRLYFEALDRQAKGAQSPSVEVDPATASVVGPRLVTSDGFGCASCHSVGSQHPVGAEPQNRGPSLSDVDQWVRRPWYERWVRAPARITPNMEMPSVQIPVQGVLNNDLDRQLAALWRIVNTPEFEPPQANPVRVVRKTGIGKERTLALTDVIRVRGQVLNKPLLVALPNRHNPLFDLQTGRLAYWWLGDAARQHTEGKTWYWEPGGQSLLAPATDQPEWELEDGTEWISPSREGQFVTEAEGWLATEAGFETWGKLQFDTSQGLQEVVLRQRFEPLQTSGPAAASSSSGFRRILTWKGLRGEQLIGLSLSYLLGDKTSIESADHQQLTVSTPLPWRLEVASDNASWLPEEKKYLFRAQRLGQLQIELVYSTPLPVDHVLPVVPGDPTTASNDSVSTDSASPETVVPGFIAETLPVDLDWMPTALAWAPNGRMYVASLKGRIWEVVDTNDDQLEDQARVIGDELAAPFGLYATDESIDVLTKYALLRVRDSDGDGDFETTRTLASGWGHTVDYHDWAVGLPRDSDGAYWIALPCQQDDRSLAASRHRGEVLRASPASDSTQEAPRFELQTISGGHRFPIGMARNRAGLIVVTDNQGNYNPFNELNHVLPGKRYGFLNAWEKKQGLSFELTPPAINIPHPWTRSVNGICFLESPPDQPETAEKDWFGPFAGHLIGCEYDTRRLVRMSLQWVDGELQGAVYPFSLASEPAQNRLLGPLTCAVSPRGEIYVGGIRDSGWGGANNIGTMLRLKLQPAAIPCGIAEVRATADGFRLSFSRPVDRQLAAEPHRYRLESYTRISTPQYGGPDVERRQESLETIQVADDGLTVDLKLEKPLRPGFVYEFQLLPLTTGNELFFPSEAYYTVNRIPRRGQDEGQPR